MHIMFQTLQAVLYYKQEKSHEMLSDGRGDQENLNDILQRKTKES